MGLTNTNETRGIWQRPAAIKANSERNTIQVMAKEAVPGTGSVHLYFIYTNNDGKQFYLSAYPENPTPPWGKIVIKKGEWQQGTPDYKNSFRLSTIRSDSQNPQEVFDTFQSLKNEMQRIDDANIPYLGVVSNSNAAAGTAMRNVNSYTNITQLNEGNLFLFAPGINQQLLSPKSNEKGLDKLDNQIFGLALPGVSDQLLPPAQNAKTIEQPLIQQDQYKAQYQAIESSLKSRASFWASLGLDVSTPQGVDAAIGATGKVAEWEQKKIEEILKAGSPILAVLPEKDAEQHMEDIMKKADAAIDPASKSPQGLQAKQVELA
jgi:hypothetical protein